MVSALSNTCRAVLFTWATLLIVHVASATNISVAAPDIQRQALLDSSWWKDIIHDETSDHCNWPGITCDLERSITMIELSRYKIKGELGRLSRYNIKGELGRLNFSCFPNLKYLVLWSNNLSGNIPSQIRSLSKLRDLELYNNNLTGTIPTEIGSMRNLETLSLGHDNLDGPIPKIIGKLTNLRTLDLSANQLNSSIPYELTKLSLLQTLQLSSNLLSGQIPFSIGKLFNLEYLDLSNNKISGSIPSGIGNCSVLRNLTLNNNSLDGNIPTEIGQFFLLQKFDLSHNNLLGIIPKSLRPMFLDLSFNNLEGEIPTQLQDNPSESFVGNKGLCGHVNGFPSCHQRHTPAHSIILFVQIFLPLTVVFALIISGFTLLYKRKNENLKLKTRAVKDGDVLSVWNYDGRILYEDLIEAAEDFDIKYCIGTGGYGSVYEAKLPDGKVVALKKLHHSETEDLAFFKSFQNEADVLSKIRHRNIVKLYDYCLHKNCNFLIYEYMERGSLFCVLRNDEEAVTLNWVIRVKLIESIAHALSYLHHD